MKSLLSLASLQGHSPLVLSSTGMIKWRIPKSCNLLYFKCQSSMDFVVVVEELYSPQYYIKVFSQESREVGSRLPRVPTASQHKSEFVTEWDYSRDEHTDQRGNPKLDFLVAVAAAMGGSEVCRSSAWSSQLLLVGRGACAAPASVRSRSRMTERRVARRRRPTPECRPRPVAVGATANTQTQNA